MQQRDQLHRFIFENTPIRGNTVHLTDTFTTALQHHSYPPVLRAALGELMAASALLAATLKMQGALVLQIQGSGMIKLLVVECTAELTMRATATWSEQAVTSKQLSNHDGIAGIPSGDTPSLIEQHGSELASASFSELIGDGRFVITLDPKDGGQAYQGIVPLEGNSISEVLQNYMLRSEQIETRIWLACDNNVAAGMLLQKLPDQPEQDLDAWPRIGYLAETVKPEELLLLPTDTLLNRLFHQEDVRLFAAQAVSFHCRCSRNSVGAMLRMLGLDEVHSILEERTNIEVNCEFCNAQYVFDRVDADQLFSAEIIIPASPYKH